MELHIDVREKKVVEYFRDFPGVVVKALDIGDFQCVIDGKVVLVIERKSLDDLAASIKDGRYKEQKLRLQTCGSRVVYLIEGIFKNTQPNAKLNRLPVKTLVSCILNMCLRDHVQMIRTTSLHHTIYTLQILYEKLMKKPELFVSTKSVPTDITESDIARAIIQPKKKNNMTPRLCSIAQLSQIPSISHTIAVALIERYGSLFGLFLVYSSIDSDEQKLHFLSNKTYTTSSGKTRKFGPAVSKQMYTFLLGKE